MIKLFSPYILRSDLEQHNDCLLRGQIDPSEHHALFQAEIAEHLGVPKDWVLLTNSGTAALEVAGRAARASSAAFPAMSWPSTWSWFSGPRRWMDVTANGIAKLPNDPGVALAGVLVALWGRHIADSTCKLASSKFPVVVLDAAHDLLHPSHGDLLHRNTVDLVCYSFGPTKQMTCGRGGAVVGKKIANQRESLEGFIHSGTERRHFRYPMGRNYRMAEPAAALGRAQLARLAVMDGRRLEVLTHYQKTLGEFLLTTPDLYSGHMAVVEIPPRQQRVWVDRLNDRGIETGIHYYVPSCISLDIAPNARRLEQRILSIPCHALMTTGDVIHVADEVLRLFHESRPTVGPPPH